MDTGNGNTDMPEEKAHSAALTRGTNSNDYLRCISGEMCKMHIDAQACAIENPGLHKWTQKRARRGSPAETNDVFEQMLRGYLRKNKNETNFF